MNCTFLTPQFVNKYKNTEFSVFTIEIRKNQYYNTISTSKKE